VYSASVANFNDAQPLFWPPIPSTNSKTINGARQPPASPQPQLIPYSSPSVLAVLLLLLQQPTLSAGICYHFLATSSHHQLISGHLATPSTTSCSLTCSNQL